MFGGVGKPAGWAIMLVAGGMVLGSSVTANAADFGGDCCADLEERVAELEATTARKGNTKVKLTVYGQVNEAIGWWDDGQETNVYQFTNDTSRTRFGFKGKAKITNDIFAEYRIEIGVRSVDQGDLSASNSAGDGSEFDLRHSYWTLGSKTYGEVSVGNTSFSYDGITQQQTANIGHFANQDIFDANDDFIVVGAGVDWSTLAQVLEPGEGSRASLVRYDSPKFKGFQVSAHWGEDDIWGVAMTYADTLGDFKVKGGIGYGEITDSTEECFEANNLTKAQCTEYGGSLSVMHKPSGLFATGSYGVRNDDGRAAFLAALGHAPDDEITHWHVQGGIEKEWIPLGKTTFFGGYHERDSGALIRVSSTSGNASVVSVNGNRVIDTQIEMFEAGFNQHLSSAAMDLYLHYKHYDADLTTTAGAVDTEAWQTVIGGAMIKF